jgi:hypothetical protein
VWKSVENIGAILGDFWSIDFYESNVIGSGFETHLPKLFWI